MADVLEVLPPWGEKCWGRPSPPGCEERLDDDGLRVSCNRLSPTGGQAEGSTSFTRAGSKSRRLRVATARP
jgi:hypothetical protein